MHVCVCELEHQRSVIEDIPSTPLVRYVMCGYKCMSVCMYVYVCSYNSYACVRVCELEHQRSVIEDIPSTPLVRYVMCVCVCMYVCMYVCICICTNIHTYTYMLINFICTCVYANWSTKKVSLKI